MKDDIDPFPCRIEDRADAYCKPPGGEKIRNVLSIQFWRDWGQLREPKRKRMFYI